MPKLKEFYFAITSFDLWISKGTHDVFDLLINFISMDWHPKNITIGLFEASEATCKVLAKNID
jgi:hypothetical protein